MKRLFLLVLGLTLSITLIICLKSAIQEDGFQQNEIFTSSEDTSSLGLEPDDEEISDSIDIKFDSEQRTTDALTQEKITEEIDQVQISPEEKLRRYPEEIWTSILIGPEYRQVSESLNVQAISSLFKVTSDPDLVKFWAQTLTVIGYISKGSGDSEGILNFLIEQEKLAGNDLTSNYVRIVSRIQAIKMLGLIGGSAAERLLRDAATEDGARTIATLWDDNSISNIAPTELNAIMVAIQSAAALGLIYTQKSYNIALVVKDYELLHNRISTDPIYSNDRTSEWAAIQFQTKKLYLGLVSAIADHRLISEMGINEYLQLTSRDEYINYALPYHVEYSWFHQ